MYTKHNFLFSIILSFAKCFYYRYRQFMIVHVEKITQKQCGYYERKHN